MFQWDFNKNTKRPIHENAFQNIVCEMAAILSGGDELRIFNIVGSDNGLAHVRCQAIIRTNNAILLIEPR